MNALVYINSILLGYLKKHNSRDTNYFTKKFTNCWYGEWLLVNKKVILMVDLDKKIGCINCL